MRVSLRFLAGQYAGETREVVVPAGRTVMIGRAPQCDLVLGEKDRTASSMHAKLWLDEAGELYLTDVGSQYGTFVNDKPVVKARLRPGDRVRFGFRGPLVEIGVVQEAATADAPPRPRPRPVKRARPVAMTTVRAVPRELLEELASGGDAERGAPATDAAVPERVAVPKAEQEDAQGWKLCPFCAERIRAAARKCRFCHEYLEQVPQSPGAPAPAPSGQTRAASEGGAEPAAVAAPSEHGPRDEGAAGGEAMRSEGAEAAESTALPPPVPEEGESEEDVSGAERGWKTQEFAVPFDLDTDDEDATMPLAEDGSFLPPVGEDSGEQAGADGQDGEPAPRG